MQPIRKLLLRDLLLLAGLLVGGLTFLAWWGLGRLLEQQVESRSRDNLATLAHEIRSELLTVERLGATVAQWWREGQIDLEHIEHMEAQIAALMEAFPQAANLVVIRRDGWGLSSLKEKGGLATYHLDARQEAGRKRYLRIGGRPVEKPRWESTPYRVFTRPWYRLALESPAPIWAPAYRFVNLPTHGLTYVIPLKDGNGRLEAAICVDIYLKDLTQRAWAAQPTPSSQVMVCDEQKRVLIFPQGTAPAVDPRAPAPFLEPLSERFLPLFDRLLGAWHRLEGSGATLRVRHQGTTYIGLVQSLEGVSGVRWYLSLAVPQYDYLAGGRRVTALLLAAGLVALLASAWRAIHLARRFSQPLEFLAHQAVTLGQGSLPEPAATDVAEIRTLGHALRTAGEALAKEYELQLQLQHAQRLETLGTLAGGIAHDVNNQLAAIVGQLNLGKSLMSPDHPAMHRLERSEDAALRCGQMLKSLLGFAKRIQPEVKPLAVNEVVQRTASLVERLMGSSIHLVLALQSPLPDLVADEVALEQVLMNLAVNARDAMPQGGRLTLGTRLDGDAVILTVKDNGIGIPEHVLPRIFDPFFTTKEVGKGTGLGLAMVFGIVKAHGGQIVVESQVGEGTTFRIRLPLKGPESAAEPAASPSSLDLAGLRVLVAEDDPPLRDFMTEAFRQRQAQVASARDGAEAWRFWQEGTFDLVVTDQRMPEITGLELLLRIRETGSQVPVLIGSGFGLEGAEHLLREDPRLRYLAKPFNLARLMTAVQELLAARKG